MSLLPLLMDELIVNSSTGLKFVSYNCRGFNDAKRLYVSNCLSIVMCCFFRSTGSLSPSFVDYRTLVILI